MKEAEDGGSERGVLLTGAARAFDNERVRYKSLCIMHLEMFMTAPEFQRLRNEMADGRQKMSRDFYVKKFWERRTRLGVELHKLKTRYSSEPQVLGN